MMVGQHKSQELISSYWELQMAAEAAVKAYLLQTTGSLYPSEQPHLLNGFRL
jgi:hypothetical protein